jgi:glutamyl-tRNA synthetase
MAVLTVPLSNSPPFLLLALALLKGDEIKWTEATSELSEPEYEGVKGVEAVRAALEQGIPGKEIPLPPLPTVFESNTPFKDVAGILDALDDYLAYRWVTCC